MSGPFRKFDGGRNGRPQPPPSPSGLFGATGQPVAAVAVPVDTHGRILQAGDVVIFGPAVQVAFGIESVQQVLHPQAEPGTVAVTFSAMQQVGVSPRQPMIAVTRIMTRDEAIARGLVQTGEAAVADAGTAAAAEPITETPDDDASPPVTDDTPSEK